MLKSLLLMVKSDDNTTSEIAKLFADKFYDQSPSRSGQLNKGASHAEWRLPNISTC